MVVWFSGRLGRWFQGASPRSTKIVAFGTRHFILQWVTKLRNGLTVKMNFIKKYFSKLICHSNSYNLNSDLSPRNFVKWILPLFFLTASCLTPIYTVPFFASVPHINCPLNPNCTLEIEASLKVTVFDHFDNNWWNGFNWIKLVFFIGFAVSHFSVGFLGDYFGKWNVFKFLVKTLILASMLTSLTSMY